MELGNLFDFENDFTEEEESVFAIGAVLPKKKIKLVSAKTGTGRTIEMKIVDDYKAGISVRELLKKYSLSTGRLYAILEETGTPLRGGINVKGEKSNYIFTSGVGERFNLTDANIRGYCQILEKQGYNFERISRQSGGQSARIFTEKDIDVIKRMLDHMAVGFTMVEAAELALYNNDVQPPKVDVKLDGETLYINIARQPKWTAEEINVVINLKEEN